MTVKPSDVAAIEACGGPLEAFAAKAERFETPCGKGTLVWRRWGSGNPVVLAHGGSGSWMHWVETIPALAQHHEVWAIDLPGLGDSSMPEAPHTPQTSGHAVAVGMRQLIAKERRPQLVGFSFGGHVSTFAAVELGDWIKDLTLSGTAAMGLPQGPGIPFAKERSTMSEAEKLEVHRYNLEILMFCNPARIDHRAIFIQANNVRRARFRSRPFARTDDIAVNLEKVRVPVKAIWGGKDQTALPTVEKRFEVLRAFHPELQTRLVADAGHWAMYEQPSEFNAKLLELLTL